MARLSHAVRLVALLVVASCGHDLVTVPRGKHPLSGGAAPVAVDSAPPAAQVEQVPPSPAGDCAWADGQWRFEDNRWTWQEGGWVRLAEDCYYADPLVVWVPTVDGRGVLFYTHGQWYQEESQTVCDAPEPCRSPSQNEPVRER